LIENSDSDVSANAESGVNECNGDVSPIETVALQSEARIASGWPTFPGVAASWHGLNGKLPNPDASMGVDKHHL
jgi:hypothetical protein